MENITKDLVSKVLKGDMNAFEVIYKASAGFVYNLALSYTGSADLAEEVTQDVFIRVFEKLKTFRFESSFKTWLYRITVNMSLNAKKKNFNYYNTVDLDSIADLVPSKESVEEEVIKVGTKQEVQKLLEKLSPNQKICVVLRNIEGLSYREIAETLKININTVRTWLKRARETLQKEVGREVFANEVQRV
jgi:RNA polymerase sigma-70 factor, ECF subfamily